MSVYFDIISGERRGLIAGLARAGLRVLSLPYGLAVSLRNRYYDYFADIQWLDCPCISVGNLTAGGTGKTPLVMWLAARLIRQGHKVAVVSRGYKGDHGGNDELLLVSQACPKAVCVANPDRVTGGRYATEVHGVDVVLLDDAFQHRRIGRDLDIVLIDASRPLGHGHLLPRGLLREAAPALRRADLVVITRLSLTTPSRLAQLKSQIADLAQDVPIVGCDCRPTGLADFEGHSYEISELLGRTLAAFAGVGNPEAFVQTLTQAGARPLQTAAYPDHHRYTAGDCQAIAQMARRAGAEMLVTTEKDMVKLRALRFAWPVPLRSLQITVDFAADGDKMLLDLVTPLLEEDDSRDDSAVIRAD